MRIDPYMQLISQTSAGKRCENILTANEVAAFVLDDDEEG